MMGIGLVAVVDAMHLEGSWLPYLALPLFLLNGAVLPGKILSGSNYVLEMASETERSLYVGLSNTLMGIVVLISGVGGLVVDLVGFAGLFALSVGLCIVAYALAARLPRTRKTAGEPRLYVQA